jgi:hypothetical protein
LFHNTKASARSLFTASVIRARKLLKPNRHREVHAKHQDQTTANDLAHSSSLPIPASKPGCRRSPVQRVRRKGGAGENHCRGFVREATQDRGVCNVLRRRNQSDRRQGSPNWGFGILQNDLIGHYNENFTGVAGNLFRCRCRDPDQVPTILHFADNLSA